MKGGFGLAGVSVESEDAETLQVVACAVTNSVGDVVEFDGSVLAGARAPDGGWLVDRDPLRRFPERPPLPPGTNTTLLAVVTNATLTKIEANRLAQRAHDGLAVAVRPAHTTHDGDTAFALATGQVQADLDLVANAAVEGVAKAIRSAVRHAETVGDIPGLATIGNWRRASEDRLRDA